MRLRAISNRPAPARRRVTFVAISQGSYTRSLIQIGLTRCEGAYAICNETMKYFWAWGRDRAAPGCSNFLDRKPIATDLGGWSGTTQLYMISKVGSNWNVYRSDVIRGQVATSSICWSKNRVDWLGESWDHGDAVGGSSGNKYYMNAARVQTVTGGTWANPNFSGTWCTVSSSPRFCEIALSDQVNIWTAH
jgi:hypothetical protein